MRKITLAGLIVVLVVLVVLAATPALAASATPSNERLQNLLKREQILLTNQQDRVTLANNVIAKAEDWVKKLQSSGSDTSAIEKALTDFKTAVANAQKYLDSAKSTLDAKAGFDSAGHVTDRAQALKTIQSAGKAERQFHLTITPAALQFRSVVLAHRQAKK